VQLPDLGLTHVWRARLLGSGHHLLLDEAVEVLARLPDVDDAPPALCTMRPSIDALGRGEPNICRFISS
jgi:hypothetical protein